MKKTAQTVISADKYYTITAAKAEPAKKAEAAKPAAKAEPAKKTAAAKPAAKKAGK